MMTSEQRSKLIQGIAFGVFFQVFGHFMKDISMKPSPQYYSGTISVVMGFVIFAWGCSHVVEAKRLPKWANILGFLSFVGLAIMWLWPVKSQDAPARQS